jgi:hypothetical protein
VNSDGPLHAVSYVDDSDQIQRVSNPDAPWSLTFTIKDPSTVLTVAAGGTAPGQQVSCEITVAGAVKDKKSGPGTADNPIQCAVLSS